MKPFRLRRLHLLLPRLHLLLHRQLQLLRRWQFRLFHYYLEKVMSMGYFQIPPSLMRTLLPRQTRRSHRFQF